MGHNSVVSGHPKSTGIPRVDKLSMGPLGLGHHSLAFHNWSTDNNIVDQTNSLKL